MQEEQKEKKQESFIASDSIDQRGNGYRQEIDRIYEDHMRIMEALTLRLKRMREQSCF